MPKYSLEREIAFSINDVARLLRTLADQRAGEFGMTRAQWAVLVRVERTEGLKQSELAEMLDLQPITLTRLIDRLCDNGLIERRADPADRRAKRLYLTPAAGPVIERFDILGSDLMEAALSGLDGSDRERLKANLSTIKDNVRQALAQRSAANKEANYA